MVLFSLCFTMNIKKNVPFLIDSRPRKSYFMLSQLGGLRLLFEDTCGFAEANVAIYCSNFIFQAHKFLQT